MKAESTSKARRAPRGLGACLICLALGLGPTAAFATPFGADDPDAGTAPDLGLMMTADALEGSSVVSLSGDTVARIEGLFIDPKDGRVELVALKFLPEGTVKALPWSALAFADGQAILDTTRIQILAAPDVDASLLAPRGSISMPSTAASSTMTETKSKTEAETETAPKPVETLKGYAPLAAYERRFDRETVETLRGTLTGTVEAPIGDRKTVDEIAFLRTGTGDHVLLALAPSWYLEERGLELDPSESVSVTGSRVDSDVGELLVVTSIEAGGRTVELRTQGGAPLWKR